MSDHLLIDNTIDGFVGLDNFRLFECSVAIFIDLFELLGKFISFSCGNSIRCEIGFDDCDEFILKLN